MEKARPKLRFCPQPSQQSSLSHCPSPITSLAQPCAALPLFQVPALSRSRWELHRCPSPCPTPRSSDPALPEVPTAGVISAFPHRLFAPPPADAGHTGHCAARSPGVSSRRCSAPWSSEHPLVPRSARRRRSRNSPSACSAEPPPLPLSTGHAATGRVEPGLPGLKLPRRPTYTGTDGASSVHFLSGG